MSYGLKVKNTAGDIIIDSVYRNFAEYESGSATVLFEYGGPPWWFGSEVKLVSFTAIDIAKPLLIAIQPSTEGFINLLGYKKTGNTWDGFYLLLGVGNEDWPTSVTINYKIFVAGLAPAAGAYGLRIYNDLNQVVFDSNRKYFKIYSVSSIQLPLSNYAYEDIPHSGISNPYYFLSPSGFWAQQFPLGGGILQRIGFRKLTSTSVRVGWNDVYDNGIPAPQAGSWNPPQKLMILE